MYIPFAPGQVVRFISGRPEMTVVSTTDELVLCTYFDKKGQITEVKLPHALLILTDINPEPMLSFETGKPVCLRSSPEIVMTCGPSNGNSTFCYWFDQDDKLQKHTFAIHLLAKVYSHPDTFPGPIYL